MVAKEAQGSMRDALSLLDQILAAFGDEVKLDDVSWLIGVADHRVHADLTRAVLERNPRDCLEIIGRLDRDGYNLPHFMTGYLEHVRDLIVVKSAGSDAPGASIPEWESGELEKTVGETSLPELYRIFSHVARAADEVARSPMPRILLETTFLKLAQNEPLTTISRLLQALGDIKRQGGVPAPRGSTGGGPSGDPPRKPERATKGTKTKGGKRQAAPAEAAVRQASPDAWGRIVEEAGTIKPFLMGILTKATPIKVDTGEVVIGFDAHSEFDSSFANEKDNMRAIENACAKVLGDRPRVVIENNSNEANAARTARIDTKRKKTDKLRKDALINPVIKEAKELFEADIKDIKIDVE
jgi:DNA polymerase III gamma/tau subunit